MRCPFCLPRRNFVGEESKMQVPVKYHSEVSTVPFGGKTITFESLTPILSTKERERRKKEVERQLFNVLIKYHKNDNIVARG